MIQNTEVRFAICIPPLNDFYLQYKPRNELILGDSFRNTRLPWSHFGYSLKKKD